MININNSLISDINKALNKSHITFTDFNFSVTEDKGVAVIKIFYSYEEKYYMIIEISGESEIITKFSPGDVLEQGSSKVRSKYALLETIGNWIDYILREMEALPNLRYINDLREELKEEIGKFEEALKEIPNQYFTKEEASVYSEKLDTLEKMFSEKFKSQENTNKELEKKLFEITHEISILKEQISILTKPKWFNSLLSKTYQWSKRHPNEMKSLTSAAVSFLPDGVKEHIPTELFDTKVSPE